MYCQSSGHSSGVSGASTCSKFTSAECGNTRRKPRSMSHLRSFRISVVVHEAPTSRLASDSVVAFLYCSYRA